MESDTESPSTAMVYRGKIFLNCSSSDLSVEITWHTEGHMQARLHTFTLDAAIVPFVNVTLQTLI